MSSASELAPAWTASFRLRRAPFPRTGLPDVAVHAPAGFDPTQPLHLVIFAHSWGSVALGWLASGDVQLSPNAPRAIGWGLDARHDVARTRTLLIAPQFDTRRPHDWAGPFGRRAFLREFLAELLGETLAPRLGGPHTVDQIASITVVGSSAGGLAAHALVANSDLADKIRNVVLFDAFYAGADAFAAWLLRASPDAPRRFVSVHAGGASTTRSSAALLTSLRRRLRSEAIAIDPPGALADAVRRHRVVVAVTTCEHIGMALLHYAKVLAGLELPRLEVPSDWLDPKTPTNASAHPLAGHLAVGGDVAGELVAEDTALRDGSRADDYALAVVDAAPVVILVHGGRSRTEYRASLDTLVQVRLGARVLAEDDDGGGGFHSRLEFTPPRPGLYTVRVTTHGPWPRLGPYTLRVLRTLPTRATPTVVDRGVRRATR